MVNESILDSFPEAALCVFDMTFVLLCVHPPQTGSVFPNTVKFNFLTLHFTYVTCNLTADNLYHVTTSVVYCLLSVAILADIWNGIRCATVAFVWR